MQFCHYLRYCREHFGLTQEEMVSHLYHAHESFEGLDAVTLSRWERCQTYPSIQRQQQFILAMRHYGDEIFPCWNILPLQEVEKEMYAKGLRKVIGKHGQTAKSIRTLLGAASAKAGKRAVLEILE